MTKPSAGEAPLIKIRTVTCFVGLGEKWKDEAVAQVRASARAAPAHEPAALATGRAKPPAPQQQRPQQLQQPHTSSPSSSQQPHTPSPPCPPPAALRWC